MKFSSILLILICLHHQLLAAGETNKSICTLDETGEKTVFYCKQLGTPGLLTQKVEPIEVKNITSLLEDHGVEIIDPLEFSVRVTPEQLLKDLQSLNAPTRSCDMFHKMYYRVDQFNSLPTSHGTIDQLEKLADALHEAGVCELDVRNENFNSINIRSKEDLLHHFLCISNSESVFGTRNIGMGGRGPWGIHPMHNQPAGTRAFVDGRTKTLRRDGLCYPSKAVVRNSSGEEIKDSDLYLDEEVILDNARCALKLYEKSGFKPWGTTNVWGSNRHCGKSTRDRLQFFKHLGPKGCCTKACRQRQTNL